MKITARQKGFTLVEALVAAAIIPLVFFAVFAVFHSSQVVFQTNGTFARLNQDSMQILRHISREIGQSSPNLLPSRFTLTTDGNNNSVLTFQIPVDCDNDGDVVDEDGQSCNPDADTRIETEWGAYDDVNAGVNGRLNAWARYSVVNNQLIREVLDPNQNAIAASRRVIANDVQTFTAARSQETVTVTLTLRTTDRVGQNGGTRDFNSTFTHNTILRTTVS